MLTLFNSLSRQKESFKPIEPHHVRMYVCGITVYDDCHIGHARMLVAFDVIYRWLMASGYRVTYVRNITDIDDKIIRRAQENNEPIVSLTHRFTEAMHQDCAALGLLSPTVEPLATEHIADMIALIERLFKRGLAYVTAQGDVCYDIHRFVPYGKLSGKTLTQLRTESRIEADLTKHNPFDFVLWKTAKPGEPSWASPWGKGRPGWHIECSAMSGHYLGEHFDIHGGGSDLQFPHHENEIAQSEGACLSDQNHPWVNYWLHNGFVNIDDKKMSKSLNNFFTIREVLNQFSGEVLRFFIVRSHYRSAINYSAAILEDAQQSLTKLYSALRPMMLLEEEPQIDWTGCYAARFKDAMDDDFNTAEAVAILFEMANELNRTKDKVLALELKALGNVLGLLKTPPEIFFQRTIRPSTLTAEAIQAYIAQRKVARAKKDWAEADRVRDLLFAEGVELEDSEQGETIWRCR